MTKFRVQEFKPANTPISTSDKITKDLDGAEVDSTYYRSIIGNLLYLAASRPDISFSVCACAKYQAAPKEFYLKAAKKIIYYVHGTQDFGLWYTFDTTCDIVGYSDAD